MTVLADVLRDYIHTWAADLMRSSRLVALARSGRLPARALAAYLEGLRYLFGCTERNLARAVERSRELGLHEITRYFEDKVREEDGHDTWAASDLEQLPTTARTDLAPSPGLIALVELQGQLIERHPICFVAYALWAEYFTVLVGDEWLQLLELSGFASTQVSAVRNHVDADRAHAAVLLRQIDSLWSGTPDATTILADVTEASRRFERFCDDVCDIATRAA